MLRLGLEIGGRWLLFFIAVSILFYFSRSIRFVPPSLPDRDYDIDVEDLQNGDLVVCSGRAPTSMSIRAFSHSPWTHVGMVVRLSHRRRHPVHLLHADIDNGCRDRLGGNDTGVQLTPIHRFQKQYGGYIYIRRMTLEDGARPSTKQLMDLAFRYKDHTFNRDQACLMRTVAGRRWWIPETHCSATRLFCSQFLAIALKDIGILCPDSPVHLYHPASYTPQFDGHPTSGMQLAPGLKKVPYESFMRYLKR